MSERFYTNCPLAPGPLLLQGAEAHHMTTVCRLRPGDQVRLFNGDGHEYPARVVAAGRREVELEITGRATADCELPFPLEVACPLPKGDRAQFLVEKLTELGVTGYTPLATQRTVTHPGEARLDKLQRYVVEASKQCGRNVLMQVHPVTAWADLVSRPAPADAKLLAHPEPDKPHALLGLPTFPSLPHSERVFVAVGPEGGFTDAEVTLAREHHWQPVHLGPRIVRVETAAVVLAWEVAATFSRRRPDFS